MPPFFWYKVTIIRPNMWIKRVFSVVVLYVIVVSLWLRNDGNLFVRQDVESNRLITLLQMELSQPDKLPQNSFVHEQQIEPVVSGELSWHFWIYFTSQWNFRLLTASLKTLIMLQWLIYKLEHVLLNIIVGTNVQVRVVVNMNTQRNLSVRLDDHLAISHAELSVHVSRRNVDNQFSRFSMFEYFITHIQITNPHQHYFFQMFTSVGMHWS